MALRIMLGLGSLLLTAGAAWFSLGVGLIVAGVCVIAVGFLEFVEVSPKAQP